MRDPVESLILDLLEWLRDGPRPYAEVMEGWRTSCPRLPVWEEANDRGLLARVRRDGHDEVVSLSAEGAVFLARHRPAGKVAGRPTPSPR